MGDGTAESSFRNLCRRRRCCPEVLLDARPDAPWAAVLVERGGGERAPAELRLTREELLELCRLLEAEGFVTAARAEGGLARAIDPLDAGDPVDASDRVDAPDLSRAIDAAPAPAIDPACEAAP